VVKLTSDRGERSQVGAVHISDGADLTVVEIRPHQTHWLLRYSGCESREDADALRGTVLWGEPLQDSDTLWVHELVGCRVLDGDDVDRGTVVAVLANPAADLLELDSGALVPTNFLVERSDDNADRSDDNIVRVDVPEGLWDL
jgi:16S rRNA processing protein RimM